MIHPSEEVQAAIIRFSEVLREIGGVEYRAISGKPNVPEDVSDAQLLSMIAEQV